MVPLPTMRASTSWATTVHSAARPSGLVTSTRTVTSRSERTSYGHREGLDARLRADEGGPHQQRGGGQHDESGHDEHGLAPGGAGRAAAVPGVEGLLDGLVRLGHPLASIRGWSG